MRTIRLYNQLARPFTLLPPLLGIISGAICAWGSVHNPNPDRVLTSTILWTVVLGSVCASFLNVASNAINQIYDLEIDRVNKPSRPLVTGELGMEQAWGFTFFTYILAILPTWWVVVYPFESWGEKFQAPLRFHETFLIYLAGLLFTVIYSVPAFGRTKARGMLANFTIAIPRGCLLKVGGWAMVAHVAHWEPWFIGGVFLLFLIGASSTKDFADIEGDRAGGCKTLPILHGPRKAAWIIAPFFVFLWLLIPLGAWVRDPQNPEHAILTGNPIALSGLGIGLTLWGAYTVWLLLRDPDALTQTENHPSWKHMYLMMMAAQIGFAVAYLI